MDHFMYNYDISYFKNTIDNNTIGNGSLEQQPGQRSLTELQQVFQTLNWLQLLHVPFILVTNTLVIVTIILVKRIHTPDNFIIAGLAIADLNHAIWNIPIQIIGYYPKTSELLKETFTGCVFRFSIPTLWNATSLSLLTLLTIDRYFSIMKPFWYMQQVTTKCALYVMFLLFGLESLRCVVLWGSLLTYNETIKNPHARCLYHNTPEWYSSYVVFIKIGIQITIAFVCTLIVGFVSLKLLRETYRLNTLMQFVEVANAKRQVKDVQITIILMFLFFFLWTPTLGVPFAFKVYDLDKAKLFFMITNHLRLLNCSVNAVVYSLSKKVYKKSFKFLLTHKPTQWGEINVTMREATYAFAAYTRTGNNHSRIILKTKSSPDVKEIECHTLESRSTKQFSKQSSQQSSRSTLQGVKEKQNKTLESPSFKLLFQSSSRSTLRFNDFYK